MKSFAIRNNKILFIVMLSFVFFLFFHNLYSQENNVIGDQNLSTESSLIEEVIIENIIEDTIQSIENTQESPFYEEEGIATQHEQEIFEEVNNEITNFVKEFENIIPDKKLPERLYKKEVNIDKEALHTCAVSSFNVDISYTDSITTQVILSGFSPGLSKIIEIGSLPIGIDVKINSSSENYQYEAPEGIVSFNISISKETGAQKGSFNVPILFTLKNNEISSTSVCQINVINLP